MPNRNIQYQPDRSRPLQRRIAEHRERELSSRNQYSTYDKLNDEGSFGLSDAGLGSWTGYRWDYSWDYWVIRVVVGIVVGVVVLLSEGCPIGGA